KVEALTEEVRIGKVYDGKVTSIKDFGAFIEILPGRDGLGPIRGLDDKDVDKVENVVKVGDRLQVKVIAIDDQDRVKLSRKALLREQKGLSGEAPPPRREGDRPGRDGGGGGGSAPPPAAAGRGGGAPPPPPRRQRVARQRVSRVRQA